MVLGSTEPLTEMSTRNLSGGKNRPARRAWQPCRHLCAECLKMWEPQPLANLRASTAYTGISLPLPVTVAERSKAWTVFARADAGTVGSNPTLGTEVYYLCCVYVFLCLCTGRGPATSWSPVQGVLPTVLDLVTEVKRKVSWRRPRPELDCKPEEKKMAPTDICLPMEAGITQSI
jgi:hypothetical protein